MTNEKHPIEGSPNNATASSAPNLGATVLHTAWLAILLGLKEILADLLKQVSWSVFVCVGLALGTAASKARAPLMGLLGLLAAPLALGVSRSLHQGVVKALEIAGSASLFTPSLLVLALL